MSETEKRQGGADTDGAGTGGMAGGKNAGDTHLELGGGTSGGQDTDGAGTGGMTEGKDAGGGPGG